MKEYVWSTTTLDTLISVPVLQLICFLCQKEATGALNRDSLITHINEEGMKDPGKEDIVPFEAGKKRGHVYIPKYNEAELEAMAKKEADAVTLECDEEEALGQANTQDLMSLAEILDSNPQVLRGHL